jgi:hypothetical protein
MKQFIRILGWFKIVFSVLLIIRYNYFLFKVLLRFPKIESRTLLADFIGYTLVMLLYIYLFYSGLADLGRTKKPRLIVSWIGSIVGIIISIFLIFAHILFFYAVSSLLFMLSVLEIIKILNQKTNNHKDETAA